MTIWVPEDNIYVTDLIALIEVAEESIRLLNNEKEKELIKLSSTESRIKTIDETLKILKTSALIVSISEYIHLNYKRASLLEQADQISRKIIFLDKNIENKKDAIMRYEDEMKDVSFKLLEFKKRE
jgi:hypothetical protein